MLNAIRFPSVSRLPRRPAARHPIPCSASVLAVLAGLLLAACGGSNPVPGASPDAGTAAIQAVDGGSVETASGKLRLDVPATALAAATTITMTEVPGAALHPDLEGGFDPGRGVVYELEPDGLVFSTPADFTLRLEDVPATRTATGWEVPLVTAVSVDGDGVAEPLEGVEVAFDLDDGSVVVSGKIAHFSTLEVRLGIFGSWLADGLPDGPIAPGDEFEVTHGFKRGEQVLNPISHFVFTETDFSVPPVHRTSAVDPDPPVYTYKYACVLPGGVGSFLVVVDIRLRDGRPLALGDEASPIEVPGKFIHSTVVLQKSVDCRPPPPKVSFFLPETESNGEHGTFSIRAMLDPPASFALQIPFEFAGDAQEGVDYNWLGETDQSGNPVLRLEANQDMTGAQFNVIDDVDSDGDLSLIIRMLGEFMLPGGIVPPDITELSFTIRDDPNEPLLVGRGTLLSASPESQTALVGENAIIETTQSVIDSQRPNAPVDVSFIRADTEILGDPTLLPKQPSFDPSTATLVNDALVPEGSLLTVSNLDTTGLSSKQEVAFPCLKQGETTVRVQYLDGSDPLTTQTLSVTCNLPPNPEIGFLLLVNFVVEGVGTLFGPTLGTMNANAGDPFGDNSTRDTQDVLDLDPARDYVLLSSEDAGYSVWDLSTGLEVERLRNEFVSPLDAIFLHAPDSSQWVFFRSSSGYGRNEYFPEFMSFGITRLFPGGRVTDLVHGPLDQNGRDTGLIITDFDRDQVLFQTWRPDIPGWGSVPGFQRSKGEWQADFNAVSAVGGFDGKALVVVDQPSAPGAPNPPGELWFFDPRESAAESTDQNLGAVGAVPAFVRCLEGVCVVTNFGGDSVTTVTWPAPDVTPSIVQTEAVGAGPYGINLIPNPAGTGVMAAISNLEDDSVNVLVVEADGVVTTNRFFPVADSCSGPSQAHFTNGAGTEVMVLCTNNQRLLTISLQ